MSTERSLLSECDGAQYFTQICNKERERRGIKLSYMIQCTSTGPIQLNEVLCRDQKLRDCGENQEGQRI